MVLDVLETEGAMRYVQYVQLQGQLITLPLRI